MGSAVADSGVASSLAWTCRPCGPVSRSMSIVPGPACSHPGTCDAPKWPPRAHSARRPGRPAWLGAHARGPPGWPHGQRRATPQVSSQLMIASTPSSGPLVNGSAADESTPICTQIRPCLFTLSDQERMRLGAQSSRSDAPRARPARSTEMVCATSPVTGSQIRWQGRCSMMRRSAADWTETPPGRLASVSQTARGTPPPSGPPSVPARMRLAPGSHAYATAPSPGKV
jgi:hypothetical protein